MRNVFPELQPCGAIREGDQRAAQAQPGALWQAFWREMQELPQGFPFRQTLQQVLAISAFCDTKLIFATDSAGAVGWTVSTIFSAVGESADAEATGSRNANERMSAATNRAVIEALDVVTMCFPFYPAEI